MTITLHVTTDDAEQLRDDLKANASMYDDAAGIAAQIGNELQNEAEQRYDSNQEMLMESGGVEDSAYRRDMKDAGRGHLLR